MIIILFEYRKIFLPLPLYLSMKSPFDCIMPDGKIAAYIIYRKMEEEGGDMNSNLQQVDGLRKVEFWFKFSELWEVTLFPIIDRVVA